MAAAGAGAQGILAGLARRSAAPPRVATVLDRLVEKRPDTVDQLETDDDLAASVVVIAGASRFLGELLVADDRALDVLASRRTRTPPVAPTAERLVTWKRRELLRIAACDLRGDLALPEVGAALSELADDVLRGACELIDAEGLAVIAMGKLGATELNYSSDIDLLLVGDGPIEETTRRARELLAIAGRCFRVDTSLRPEGRDGSLVRSIDSYEAYWGRWAQPWEFQALLKARAAAGDERLGRSFADTAARWLWSHPFTADDLRAVRALKARAEREAVRRPLGARDLKRAPGGIRDIEFSAQLLQLVHGRADASLRDPRTLVTLEELASAGYVDGPDAAELAETYAFLRTVEHRLQLDNDEQTHTVPVEVEAVGRLARVLGYRDDADGTAAERFEIELRHRRGRVRTIHERLYFRPLLEAFAGARPDGRAAPLGAAAAEQRLSAFGFTNTTRTTVAVQELTRGLNRTSRLMQQLLPLVLDWLAASPDPDLGLLMLRNLLTSPERATQVLDAFRESPDVARQLCLLLGTSRQLGEIVLHNPDVVERLGNRDRLVTAPAERLRVRARRTVDWRPDEPARLEALRRWRDRQLLGIAARDLLGEASVAEIGHDLGVVADAAVDTVLAMVAPQVPFAVVAVGSYGGGSLSYGSDLDLLYVYEGDGAHDAEEAHRTATAVGRLLSGATPAQRIFEVDPDLRPEGRQGALARSLGGFERYWTSYAEPWERLAMTRARSAAGDQALGAALLERLSPHVWDAALSPAQIREIRRVKTRVEKERLPAGADRELHLKLGRGAITDVEFTIQLLQLRHGRRGANTAEALQALALDGLIDQADAHALAESLRFCTGVRNRLELVLSGPADTMPSNPEQLTWLARSLETTAADLRQTYRRVTRRARVVTERLFFGQV